jgi:hypothetical protein
MKVLEIPDTFIGCVRSMPDFLEVCFGEKTMQAVHGPGVQMDAWKMTKSTQECVSLGATRTLRTDTPFPSDMPAVLRAFGGGDKLRMTVRQHLLPLAHHSKEAQTRICARRHFKSDIGSGISFLVRNDVRLHVLGAEFCKVMPTFRMTMEPTSGRCSIGAAIKMYAILPPPLDKICERFMENVCRTEVQLYVESAARHHMVVTSDSA